MKLAAGDIYIEHLTLRGQRHDTRSAVRAMQRISAPDMDQRWYIIRLIQFRSPAQKLAKSLGTNIEKQISQAIHGSHPGAKRANVIFFYSLDELLTQLILDLSKGRGDHWYWQQWLETKTTMTTSQQITRLWCEYSDHLPQIFQQLSGLNHLVEIILNFNTDQIKQIITTYSHKKGMSTAPFLLPAPQQTDHTHFITSKKGVTEEPDLVPTDLSELGQLTNKIPAEMNASWLELIARLKNHPHQDQHLRLSMALLVSVTSSQPTLVESWKSKWPLFVIHWRELLIDIAKTSNPTSFPYSGSVSDIPILQISETNHATSETRVFTDTTNRKERHAGAHSREDRDKQKEEQNYSGSVAPVLPYTPEFICEYGGFFYLINPVQRYLQLHPDRCSDMEQTDAGWALLWQLAILLLGQDKYKLSSDHGLIHLLEQAVGEEPAKALFRVPLKQLPEDIYVALTKDKTLRSLCISKRLKKSAHIRLTRSHLDACFSSQCIDLDIRLAGLDINPGWVPWLGRVVHFHYRDEQQLCE